MKRLFEDKSSGFSMVEALIAVAIGGMVITYASSMIKATIDSNKIARRLNIVSELETSVQQSFLDPKSFERTKEKNPAISECVELDSKNCKLSDASVDLWLEKSPTNARKLTGFYDANLKPCKVGCALELRTKMNASCETGTTCDAAAVLSLSYEIFVGDQAVRRGAYSRQIITKGKSDMNIGCGVDAVTGIPQYVNSVDLGSLACVSIPGIPRTLKDVSPGECERGREILAGFDNEGKIICVPIVFTPK